MERTDELNGQLVVVTGGTGGIGLATARGLAVRGATTVLVGRRAAPAEQAVASLRAAAGHDRVHYELADLSVRTETVTLAGRLTDRFGVVDTLLNNAGALRTARTVTATGDETMLTVNHLAPILLTHYLLPALRRSPSPHVIGVNSAAHSMARVVDPDDLQHERSWPTGMDNVYARSKLINLMVTRELARVVPDVPRNLLNPGGARTSMITGIDTAGAPVSLRVMTRVTAVALLLSSPDRAARAGIALAAEPRYRRDTGRYYGARGRPAKVSRLAQDRALARQLLAATSELLDLDITTGRAA